MSPKVSVIIPAYNSAAFITDSINSVLAQDNSSQIEVIVIDDKSTDDTREVVSSLGEQHPQVKLFTNGRKKGPSGARNTGLLNATGDYVAFLDSDDLWLPNHLKEGVNFLEANKNADVVFFNFEIHEFESKTKTGEWFSEKKFINIIKTEELEDGFQLVADDMFNLLLSESFMHLQSMIIRKGVLEGILFNENIIRSEDRDFSVNLFVKSKATFAFKNVVTGIYYRHANSLTSISVENSLLAALDHIKLLSEYLEYDAIDSIKADKINRILYDRHRVVSYKYRQLNQYGLSLKYLLASCKYDLSISIVKELVKFSISFVKAKLSR